MYRANITLFYSNVSNHISLFMVFYHNLSNIASQHFLCEFPNLVIIQLKMQSNTFQSQQLRYPSQLTNTNHEDYVTEEPDYLNFKPPEHKYIETKKYQSSYFKDNNEEQYVLQRAFQANNFTYLRKLPDNFARNCILDERKQRVQDQIAEQSVRRMKSGEEIQKERESKIAEIKKAKIGTLGYFELFPYQQSDYNIPKHLARSQRVQKTQKRKQISELQFRPSGFDKKLKHQDPFRYQDRLDSTVDHMNNKQQYLFPFHLPQDVYDLYHESQLRQKLVQNQLKVAGEFKPSKTAHSLNNQSKTKLPEILNEIEYYFKKILKDKFGYFIGVNKKDHIEVFFEGKYQDQYKVQMAMSGILQHQILSKFSMRKNINRWGVINKDSGYLEFVILPPWVIQQEFLRTKVIKTQPKTK